MNLVFLIGFMTFHFYLNLAFHANVSTIRILIVIYFNFFGPSISTSYTAGTSSKGSLATYFLTLTFFDFISLGICHIFYVYDRQIFGE